jgi:Domain of unknown function (DUF4114)
MTNIIVGQNINGSLTSTSPQIVDPTSPFNGQFYDDFDVSSVNVLDPSNLPFLLAANKELGDIGSVKVGEVRSTNIFILPPAGSAPGASTTIQLINTKTNSVDAQATSSGSEPLKFVKNAEIVGSDYKIRVINATPGDYQISLAGAIQTVQVVGSDPTTATPIDPTGSNLQTLIPPTSVVPPILVVPTEQVPLALVGNQPNPTSPEAVVPPPFLNAVVATPEPQLPTVIEPIPAQPKPVDVVEPVITTAVPPTDVIDPLADNPPIPTRGTDPLPNERGPIKTGSSIDPSIDPVIFQNAVGSNPPVQSTPVADGSTSPTTPVLPAPPVTRSDNFLKTSYPATGFSISAISQKPGNKVNEIGIFAVDDATGKVNGIAPGAAGYLQAVTNSARSIFSTFGGDFFESSSKREIVLEPNTYGFFEVQDGSIADLKQQLANGQTPTNVLFSTPGTNGVIPIQLTNNDTSGYNLSVNQDELVLKVIDLNGVTPTVAIGAKSQGLAEGRTIDLTGFAGQTLKADIITKSSAAYTNNIGFYAVEDSIGTIKLADGNTLKPGDIGYAAEAIKNALANSVLQAGKTDSKLGQNITGGKIYAPVVVSQGSLSDFIATNPTNIGGGSINAYFNYIGANSDKTDHFRLIGSNTFGVEDQYGGGDRDFNDLVVNMNVKTA